MNTAFIYGSTQCRFTLQVRPGLWIDIDIETILAILVLTTVAIVDISVGIVVEIATKCLDC